MDRTTIGLLTFFVGGVFIYAMARYAKPWPDKHQRYFWLAALSPLIFTLFILPGYINDSILNGVNALVAGLIFSEYMRTKHKSKLERIQKLGNDVKAQREKALKQGEGEKTRSNPEKKSDKKRDGNK